MQHATWSAIESSPVAMGVYRFYRKLVPPSARTLLRWFVMPRWNAAAALVRHRAANTVLSGPFRGMRLSLTPVSNRNLLGYLLGTQEAELHDVVRRVIARGYSRIINVGAADGYYAVGFLREMPTDEGYRLRRRRRASRRPDADGGSERRGRPVCAQGLLPAG